MEQEWTEDEEESIPDSTPENFEEITLSGDEPEDHLQLPSTSNKQQPTRRSTRTSVTTAAAKVNTSNEDELPQNSPEVELDEGGLEEQEEWKPPEKNTTSTTTTTTTTTTKRRRKAPITRRKRSDHHRRNSNKSVSAISGNISNAAATTSTSTAGGRPRGRPRRDTQQQNIEISEGQFDIYDEDKTPEREDEPEEDGSEDVSLEMKNEIKEEIEESPLGDQIANEEMEVVASDGGRKITPKNQQKVKQETQAEYIPEEPQSNPKTHHQQQSHPSIPNPQESVVAYGLEESEEEGTVAVASDSERTLSVVDEFDDRGFDLAEDHDTTFNLEEIQRPIEETAQGSGAFVIDTIRSSYNNNQNNNNLVVNPAGHGGIEDDENTQYSVEAELAQYAREDEINARLDREMEEIGLKEDGIGESQNEFHESRVNRSNIHSLRLEPNNEDSQMDFQQSQNTQETNQTFIEPNEEEFYDSQSQYFPDAQQIVAFSVQNTQENEGGSNFVIDCYGHEGSQEEMETDTTAFFSTRGAPGPSAAGGAGGNTHRGIYNSTISPVESESSTIEITMSQLCHGNEVFEVPDLILENESIFYHVLSKNTFNSLSEEQQNHLKKFLPRNCESEKDVQKCITSALTYNPKYYFGSPMTRAFNRIRAGYYNVERPLDLQQLQESRRVWYDHFIRQYYMKLLKRMLLTRHAILEQAANIPENCPIKINGVRFSNLKKRDNQELIKFRAKKRARMLINFAAEKSADDTPSSDDSDDKNDEELLHLPIKHEIEGESTYFSPEYADCDLDMYQPARMKSIKELLKEYTTLRKKNPNCPSLDTSDITLEDVYERSGLSFQSERNFVQWPQGQMNNCGANNKRKRKRKTNPINEVVEEEINESHQSPASMDPDFVTLEHSLEGLSQALDYED